MGFKVVERDEFERELVSGLEDDFGRRIVDESLLPALGAKAPAVTWLHSGKLKFRVGGREVVADFFREREKGGRGDDADRVHSDVLGSGLAATIPVETGHGNERARNQ